MLNCRDLAPLLQALFFEPVPVQTSGNTATEGVILAIRANEALLAEETITYSDNRSTKVSRWEQVPSRQIRFGNSGHPLQELRDAIRRFCGDNETTATEMEKQFWLTIVSQHLEPSAEEAKRKVNDNGGTENSQKYLKEVSTQRLHSLFSLLLPLFKGHRYTQQEFRELDEPDITANVVRSEEIDTNFLKHANSVLRRLIDLEMCSPDIYEFLKTEFQ